jgi:hypothetical protein
MAARVRSDCRIAWGGASMRNEHAQVGSCCAHRTTPASSFQSGCVDLHLQPAREGHIMVAPAPRGRGQHHRSRGMSTGIRAPVHEQEVGASTVTFG